MFDDRIGNLQKMLARMGPEGRQKYATDHADDPIAVSMALFVNNIAKEIKEGKRGEPEIQTPVVQQAIQAMNQPSMPPQVMPPQGQPQAQQAPQAPQQAPQQVQPQGQQQVIPLQGETQMAADGGYMDSRLPEDMGIGALPERSLSNMADGGIIGYAERGLVSGEEYTQAGLDSLGKRLDIIREARARAKPPSLRDRQTDPEAPQRYDALIQLNKDAQKEYENYAEKMGLGKPAFAASPPPAGLPSAAPNATPSVATMPTDATRRGDVRFPVAGAGPAVPPAVAPSAVPPAVAPSAVRPAAAPAAPTPAAAAPSVNAAAGLQALATSNLTAQDIVNARKDIAFAQDPVVDTLKAERQALVDESNKNAAAELTSFKERMAKQGDPYAKQEERANKQEASIAESAERSPYLALMEAGFAMMAGDSPYAMKNIGAGAMVGTKAYKDGLALLEKAKEKLSETRDRIDGLRLIRSDLNDKEERDINRGINKTALEGKTLMFSALEKLTDRSQARIEADTTAFLTAETARRLADRQYNTEVMRQREESARNAATNVAAGIRNAASISSAEKIAAGANKPQILYQKAIDTAVAEAVSSMAYQIAKTPAEKAQLEADARARARTNFLTVYPELAGTMKGVGSPLDLTKWGSPVKN